MQHPSFASNFLEEMQHLALEDMQQPAIFLEETGLEENRHFPLEETHRTRT